MREFVFLNNFINYNFIVNKSIILSFYFQVSRKFHTKCIGLRVTNGSLTVDKPVPARNKIPIETRELVKTFYNTDDVSRMWPGLRDFVTIIENGMKVQIQKRTLLSRKRWQ